MNWAAIELRLAELAGLKKDWDSYGAEPPSSDALSRAQYFLFLSSLHFAYPAKVNPSVVGGVGVSYAQEGKRRPSVYVEFRNTGSTLVAWLGSDVKVETVPADPQGQFFEAIREFVRPEG